MTSNCLGQESMIVLLEIAIVWNQLEDRSPNFGQAAMPQLRERFETLGYSDRELQACRLAPARKLRSIDPTPSQLWCLRFLLRVPSYIYISFEDNDHPCFNGNPSQPDMMVPSLDKLSRQLSSNSLPEILGWTPIRLMTWVCVRIG